MIETDVHDQAVKPPRAPSIERRISLRWGQWAGVSLLFAVSVLSVFGVFGAGEETAVATAGPLQVTVVHASRTRYMTTQALDVTIDNAGPRTTPAVTLGIGREYVAAFSDVRFVPSVGRIDAQNYLIELGDLAPGTTRHVRAWLQADAYGRHTGNVSFFVDGDLVGAVPIATLTFP